MNPLWQNAVPLSGIAIIELSLIDKLNTVFVQASKPDYILCGVQQAAAIRAHVDFQGRDRRRIKREVNKAMRKARA